ncbi:MAG: succinylglutamate-semialdehyde dehydrogenase [Planctomycetota bacterium]
MSLLDFNARESCFINGVWVEGQGEPLTSTCPVDETIVWEAHAAAEGQVDDAFGAARAAFGHWWDVGVEGRLAIAERFATIVDSKKEELATLIASETGKPLWESRTEAAAVVGKVGVSIDSLHTRRSTTSFEISDGVSAVTRFKPHGVCGVLGPFNFPAHLPNGHIVPALIAGNTIVFKPSEVTPAVGHWMVKQWEQAGLPPGVLNLVPGKRDVGIAISKHDQLDGLFFTGSSVAGVALSKTLAPTPQKILALEMGGNNPLIVHQVGDMAAAAYTTILSAYLTAGQRCTCARRLILVNGAETETFLATLTEMIGKVTVGFYQDDPQPFMGTVISKEMGRRLLEAQAAMIDKGARSLVAMATHRGCDALVSPGLIDVTDQRGERTDEELFGPLLNVIRVDSFNDAINEANNTQYGLSAGLLSDSAEFYQEFIHRIRAGIVNWNRQTTGASGKLPFGGCGLSGNHRPSAYYAIDYCNFPVASMESPSLCLPDKLMTGIDLS